nr:uncharacterized protein LOC111421216 [Onthophagus taurus]
MFRYISSFTFALFIIFLIIITQISSKSVPASIPTEIQHAVCKITTEKVQAVANASISRELKGVCSSKEMHEKIDEIHKSLFKEIQVLKLMLQGNGFTTPKPTFSSLSLKSFDDDYDYLNYLEDDFKNYTNLEIKNRENEVRKFNETIIKTDLGKAFVYYWRILNVSQSFKNDVYFISPQINFLNANLFIKCSINLFVKFQLLETAQFKNRYRFVLLHSDEKHDFNSSLFQSKVGKIFRIERKKLFDFVFNDAILIKLIVYLN